MRFYKVIKPYCLSQCRFCNANISAKLRKTSYWIFIVEKISLGIAYLGTIDTNSTNTLQEFTYSSPFDKENPTITKRCYEEKDEVNNTNLFSLQYLTAYGDDL